jgi:putative transposase
MQKQHKPFIKGYKFRIYPTEEQKKLLANTFGSCRFVYNRLLADAKAEYEAYKQSLETPGVTELKKPSVSSYDLAYKLTILKSQEGNAWLYDVSSIALQQSAMRLGDAFTNFFRNRNGYPKFKNRYSRQSFTLTKEGFRFKEGKLYIAKSKEPLEVHFTRELPSEPIVITISKTPSNKYFISFLCEYTPTKTSGTKLTGIDLGLSSLITLSDGTKVTNPYYYRKSERKLRRLQQTFSRKKKESKNKRKAHIALAKCHERISNRRLDHLHKLTRTLVNESQVIGLENLAVKNMVKHPNLSKSISDASWGTFLKLLSYKAAESQHCTVILVDRYFPSSHLCSVTGKHLGRKLDLKERSWHCPHCGQTHDRDVNAAVNIAKEAMMVHYSLSPEEAEGKTITGDRDWKCLNRKLTPIGQSVAACGEFLSLVVGNCN